MTPYHFFISRAGEDREWAKWIANVLEAAGHTTTLQDFDFKPGQRFLHEMNLAEARADHFIAVLSPDYLAKPHTLGELYSGIAEQPVGEKRLLIPVRVAPCEIPRLIKDLIFVDFVGKDWETCRQLLLDAILPDRIAEQVAFPGHRPEAPSPRTFIRTLPTVDPHLFGRDAQLDWLEQSWSNPQTNFVQIIAPGGAGKTALMTRWYRRTLPVPPSSAGPSTARAQAKRARPPLTPSSPKRSPGSASPSRPPSPFSPKRTCSSPASARSGCC